MTEPNPELREACGRLFETICNLPEGHKGQCGFEPASILADARIEAFEIHNRFCGENGEPCQVCRLKAEREGK